jgi:hypothetical protein
MRKYYLEDGTHCDFIQRLDDGNYLVEIINTDGNEYFHGPLKIVHTIYDKPPIHKKEEYFKKVDSEIKKLYDVRGKLIIDISTLESAVRLKKIELEKLKKEAEKL